MTRCIQTQTQEQDQLITVLAIDAIDAYTLAHETVSDLSAIFEALDKLALDDLSNERIARMLSLAGFKHATDRLQIIDQKMDDANKTFDELKAARGIGT